MSLSQRQEGIALRPYAGLAKLEEHFEKEIILSVTTNNGVFDLLNRRTLGLAKEDLESLGITLKVNNIREMQAAASPVVMDLSDIDFVVVAKDRAQSPLRQTVVIQHSKLADLRDEMVINAAGVQPIVAPLHNKDAGFIIEFALVHNKNIPGEYSIRPRDKGALLVLARFEVKPVTEGDSFQPEPLTDEIREMFRLNASAWMYAEFKSGLLTADTFSDAARFYVHESILADIQYLQGDEGFIAESLLQTQFVTALIYEVSAALRSVDVPDEEEIVQSQVFLLFAKRFPAKSTGELLEWLKLEPSAVLAAWQSKAELSLPLVRAIKNLNGGNLDVSSPEA